jgi:hypothetical protein
VKSARRAIDVMLVAGLTLAAVIAPVGAAQAASSFTLGPPSNVRIGTTSCSKVTTEYMVTPDPAASYWELTLTMRSPDGEVESWDSAGSHPGVPEPSSTSGSSETSICFTTPGIHTITGELTTRNASHDVVEAVTATVSFQVDPTPVIRIPTPPEEPRPPLPPPSVRKAHSVTRLTSSGRQLFKGHPIVFKVRLTADKEPWVHARVHLELYDRGAWSQVVSARSDRTGRVQWTLTPKRKLLRNPHFAGRTFKFRAITDETTSTHGNFSPNRKVHFG